MFALGTSSHVFVLRYALKNGLERKNYAQFFALVPDVDISTAAEFDDFLERLKCKNGDNVSS